MAGFPSLVDPYLQIVCIGDKGKGDFRGKIVDRRQRMTCFQAQASDNQGNAWLTVWYEGPGIGLCGRYAIRSNPRQIAKAGSFEQARKRSFWKRSRDYDGSR